MIRAIRYRARLGWEMDPRTQARYDNAKTEGVIEHLSAHARSEELEQIGHEEDGLKVLRALEAEGWMKVLFPAWTSAKADEAKLTALHDLAVQLLVQGIHPDMSAAQMQLLTAKLPPNELSALKKSMLRPGFVEEWNKLDSQASGFAKVLLSKQNAKPSASYKLFMSYDPEAVLWLGFISKDKAVQERFNHFLKVWPEARQRIPHLLMQEMRITPELPIYGEVSSEDLSGADRWQADHAGGDARIPRAVFAACAAASSHHQAVPRETCRSQNQGSCVGGRRFRGCVARRGSGFDGRR